MFGPLLIAFLTAMGRIYRQHGMARGDAPDETPDEAPDEARAPQPTA